jgi:HPt (histidine-containing phosphotransfer) domain-containing protein
VFQEHPPEHYRREQELLMNARDLERRGGRAVDRSVLGEWLAGDDQAINELLILFRDSAVTEHQRMASALTGADLDEFAKAAHRLRGVALSMGAQALGEIAGALETAGKALDAAACQAGMPGLERQMHLMVAEVPTHTTAPPR